MVEISLTFIEPDFEVLIDFACISSKIEVSSISQIEVEAFIGSTEQNECQKEIAEQIDMAAGQYIYLLYKNSIKRVDTSTSPMTVGIHKATNASTKWDSRRTLVYS